MQIYDYLCKELQCSEEALRKFAKTAPSRYKIYTIPKRTHGKRVIAHPARPLKRMQRLLIDYFEPLLPVHSRAKAYRTGVSIKDNAAIHVNNSYLLKMDFKNFFPSITPSILRSHFDQLNLQINEDNFYLLQQLLFCRPSRRQKKKLILSIGAPSSPLISNSIMFGFDTKIKNYSKQSGVQYSRYADDITFSTCKKDVLFEFPTIVERILDEEFNGALTVNTLKTVFSSKAHNRHVTGVTITNDGTLSIGRERKRYISSLVHRFTLDLLDSEEIAHLKGNLAYAKNIEPEFIVRLESKYSKQVVNSILRFNNG